MFIFIYYIEIQLLGIEQHIEKINISRLQAV